MFFWLISRAYPVRAALMLTFLLLGVALEGVGLGTLLTMLVVLLGDVGGGGEPGALEQAMRNAFAWLGIELSVVNMLTIVVGATLVESVLSLLSKQQVGFIVARIATDFRLLMVRALAAARWSYFTREPIGSIAASVSSEAGRAAQAYLSFATALSLSAQALLYGGIALALSWEVSLSALAAAALVMFSMKRLVTLTRRVGRKQTQVRRSLLRHMADGLQAIKPLKAMAREQLVEPLIERDAKRLNKVMRQQVVLKALLGAIESPATSLFAAAGIYVSLTYLQVPMAELGVLILLFTRTLQKLTRTQRQYQQTVLDEEAVWALRDQIDRAHAHRESDEGELPPHFEEAIRLDRVRLGYGDRRVLDGFSLEIPAGQVCAVIGASGSGKTTAADLVCGLLRPDHGSVTVDGVPLDEIDLRAWRRTIGYVPQEIFLINASIRDNVTLGEDIDDAAVEQALRRAGAWEFVSEMPEGIDTNVGERGSLLSGGQRQRLCIARALVHEPRLLILDEATTALDPETEAHIWDSIVALRGDVTVLAISHQPLLRSVADRVYRVEGGKAHREEAAPQVSGGGS